MGRTYLDFNATTPMPEPVRRALAEAAVRLAGNPSSPHREGQEARRVLDEAREEVARLAGVRPDEVIFTSGGTESNNLALRGLAAAAARTAGRSPRILVSAVEHPSVLETARDLARDGASVEILPVDRDGRLEPAVLEEALARGADVVSVMHANNETGVIQPIEDLAAAAFEAGAAFHTDMCQALGKIPIDAAAVRATACSLAAHKIGGPPGIGALLLRRGTAFASPMTGGAQEGRRRAGTEPVLLAAGFAAAARALDPSQGRRLATLRDGFEARLRDAHPRVAVHGAGAPRVPNTSSFHLPGLPGRHLVIRLDLAGFAVSTGSACSTGSARPSHVLEAMGCPPGTARDSLRVSLGAPTTSGEIDHLLEALGAAAAPPGEEAGGRALAALPARNP